LGEVEQTGHVTESNGYVPNQMGEKMQIIISSSFMILTILSLFCFLRNFRAALNHLKTKHPKEFKEIKNKDSLIDAAGSWIRWPVGSAYSLFSVLNPKENFSDKELIQKKRRAMIYFCIFILGFIVTITSSM